MILAELTKAGLISKILSEIYDGTSVKALWRSSTSTTGTRKQKDPKDALPEPSIVAYLVAVSAMLVEQAINNFLCVCGSLYYFFASPHLHFTIMVKNWNACLSRDEMVIWLQQQLFSILFNI